MEAIAANILLEGLAVNALAQCETPGHAGDHRQP